MAVIAKKGSQLMKDARERRERAKATKDSVNMAGTTLGKIMGVKEEEIDTTGEGRSDIQQDTFTKQVGAPVDSDGDGDGDGESDRDYRADAQYGDHMKRPNEAVSE